MKLKKFTARYIQSIEELTVYFKPKGVYIFTGLNNIGKSSLLNSMGVHFYNSVHQQYKKDFVRDGYDSLETESETYDGYTVFQKRGVYNSYTITRPDGTTEDYYKLERDVPYDIKNIFNLYTDPVSGEKINFRANNSDLMLVNTSPKETYDILQYAIKTTEINDAIVSGNANIKDAKNFVDMKIARIDALTEQSQDIKILDLDDVENAMTELETLDKAILCLENSRQYFSALDVIAEKEKLNQDELTSSKECLQLLSTFNTLRQYIANCKKVSSIEEKSKENSDRIADLNSVISKLRTYSDILRIKSSHNRLVKITDSMSKNIEFISSANELISVASTASIVKRFIKSARAANTCVEKLEANQKSLPSSLIQELRALRYSRAIITGMGSYRDKASQIKVKKAKIIELETKKTQLFHDQGYCPYCKSRFGNSHDCEVI